MGFSIVPSEKKFRVVGVTPTSDSGGGQVGFNNAGMYLPLAVAEKLQVVQQGRTCGTWRDPRRRGERYAALNVRASSPAAVAQIESSVTHMGFATFSLIDVTRNLRTFFAIFDLFLGIFGSLALAVASLGIINTLVMAILERRREIGVLKALGAADRDVRQLFFAEAGVMGLAGGVFGVLLGWAIGRAIQFGTDDLSETAGNDFAEHLVGAVVAGAGRDRICGCGQPGVGNLSRIEGGAARSGGGAAV